MKRYLVTILLLIALPANAAVLVVSGSPPVDTDPPTPNPATWAVAPYPVSTSSIRMEATEGADASGVWYKFVCTAGGGHDSVWQTSPIYIDTGLQTSTQYTYTVQMRDGVSPTPNTGTASAEASATTLTDAISYLTAGTEFSGTTANPGLQGSSGNGYYDCNAMARWEGVPYRRFDGNYCLGVWAEHASGIAKVSISVEGGPTLDVTAMSTNPRTGSVVYNAYIAAADFPTDEEVEVRATAYPVHGNPKVLQGLYDSNGVCSLWLWANNTGTFTGNTVYCDVVSGSDTTGDGSSGNPYETIDRAIDDVTDGGFVTCLSAGEYNIRNIHEGSSNNYRYITITKAAGLAVSDVVIISDDETQQCRPGYNRLRFYQVTIDWERIGTFQNIGDTFTWFDDCVWTNVQYGWASPTNEEGHPHGACMTFATDCLAYDCFQGFNGIQLTRNCDANQVSGDVYNLIGLNINCRMTKCYNQVGWEPIPPGWHSDGIQYFATAGDIENYLVKDFTATDVNAPYQLWLLQTNHLTNRFIDCSFTNVTLTYNTPHDSAQSQCQGQWKHFVFRNVSNEQQIKFRSHGGETPPTLFEPDDVLFTGCTVHPQTFADYVNPGTNLPSGVTFENTTSF